MTDWRNYAAIICLDKDAGNALANMAASYRSPTAELGTFTDERRLALASDPTTPVAWWAVTPCKDAFAGVCNAIADGAEYMDERLAYLRQRDVTEQQWAVAKAVFPHTETGLAGQYDYDDFAAFAAANGYTIVEAEQP